MVKARANARNIVGPNMLRAFAHHVVCCCVLLRLIGSCRVKFETGQTSEPTSANISIVSRSSKRGPTMLRSFAQHIQQCCAGACALHATYPLWFQLFYFILIQIPNMLWLVASVCTHRLTSRNKRQQCWPNNVACCCERLHGPLGNFS